MSSIPSSVDDVYEKMLAVVQQNPEKNQNIMI